MVRNSTWVFIFVITGAVMTTAALSRQGNSGGNRGKVGSGQCATEEPSIEEMLGIEAQSSETIVGETDALIMIPIAFHVISNGTSGNVPDQMLIDQVAFLNAAYSGIPGGANTQFRFEIQSIDRTVNAAWYTAAYHSPEEYAMKEALHVGNAMTLNFYTTNSPWNWSALPWVYSSEPLHDGVVVRNDSLTGSGHQYFGTGDIAVHEVGHWLGLYHTFQGECSTTNDMVADTPAMKSGGPQGCPAPRDTCKGKNYPGTDPLHNYMTGMVDSCETEFTTGQSARMSSMWTTYRD
jgi:hypothetical protein